MLTVSMLTRHLLFIGLAATLFGGSLTAVAPEARAQTGQKGKQAPAAAPIVPATPQPIAPGNLDAQKCFGGEGETTIADPKGVAIACSKFLQSAQGEVLDRSRAHARRAGAFFAMNDLPGAIADWGKAIELTPGDFYALVNRAVAYQRLGQLDEAKRDYTAAIALAPQNPEPYKGRAQIYRGQGNYTAAIGDFNAILRADQRNLDALHGRGIALQENSQPQEAIRSFTEALAVNQQYVPSLVGRGIVRFESGDTKGAAEDLNAALKIAPDTVDAMIGLGQINMSTGAFDRALEICGKAALADQQDPSPFLCQGEANKGRGDFVAARTNYESALQRARTDRKRLEAYIGRGFANYKSGRHEQAIADLNAALEIDKNSVEALSDLANVLADDSQLDRGRERIAEAIRLAPNDPTPLIRAAGMLAAAGATEEALSRNNEALALAPRNFAAYLSRAYTHLSRKDWAAAAKDLGEAERLLGSGIRNFHVLNLRGRLNLKQGNMRSAINDLNEANALSPNRWEVLRDRGIVKYNLREYDGAVSDLIEATKINPRFAEPHYYLGLSYQAQGAAKRDPAIASFSTAIAAATLPLDVEGREAQDLARKALDVLRRGPAAKDAKTAETKAPEKTAGQPEQKTADASKLPPTVPVPPPAPTPTPAPGPTEQGLGCRIFVGWAEHVYRYTGVNPRGSLCK